MPVVNEDWRDPTTWAPAALCWAVVRDGSFLHFARFGGRGVPETWTLSAEQCGTGAEPMPRLRQDMRRGGRLVAGLSPASVVLRTLHSPLQDAGKSSELWPGLLDAALPFSLEECVQAFSPPRPAASGNGWQCDAYAARISDLNTEITRWKELDLEPHFLIPEASALVKEAELTVWTGRERSVFLHRNEAGEAAATGAGPAAPDSPALRRFCLGRSVDPSGARILEGADLPARLAELAFRGGAELINLRAEDLASPALAGAHRAARVRKLLAAGVMIALALLSPWLVSRHMSGLLRIEQQKIGSLYTGITGERSRVPGQELLMAERWLETEWAPLWSRAQALASPESARRLGDLLRACQFTGAQVREITMRENMVVLDVVTDERAAGYLAERLRRDGWKIGGPEQGSAGQHWILRGERTP